MTIMRFLIVSTFFAFAIGQSQAVKVMTYNIKYDNTNDTVNNWNDRKAAMVELIKHYDAEFIGMQEVLFNQLTYLNEALVDYNYIGVGRDDGKKKGEFSPILYNTKKYKLLDSKTFWLSETPEKISVGWDAAMERICTYGLFEDINTKIKLWVFNSHFDHIGVLARKKSVALIVKKIEEINTGNFPSVLMGDFNLTPDSKAIQYLKKELSDGLENPEKAFYGPIGTFNGFDPDRILDKRIDYIFVENFRVQSYIHIDDRMENNKHISDHLPVLVSVSVKN